VINWSEIPDLAAVALLTIAFASVSRRNQTPQSKIWLTAWGMIALHFAAFVFLPAPAVWGILAATIGTAALIWAALLFVWASVPDREDIYSRWMMAALLTLNTAYIVLLDLPTEIHWAMNLVAAMMGAVPLAIALFSYRSLRHPLQRGMVAYNAALAVFLLAVQHRPGGEDLALNAVLFSVYFGCCVHFWHMYRRATAGAFITIAGFLAWALVFVIGPAAQAFLPQVQIQNEVWNLPKYVVAVGMILLLLEDQIEHNQYLALHDTLTALPNRRLFQDRLATAVNLARRNTTQAAMLVIDLDGFKEVNDTLQQVADVFRAQMRPGDTVARTGGDEFSVLLEGISSRDQATEMARSLADLMNQPLELGDHLIRVGASVGVAVFPADASDVKTLCIKADLRMYEAKQATVRTEEQRALQAAGREAANREAAARDPKLPRPAAFALATAHTALS
jgi:diguanylate cyclase (GGDEF)-like protein